VRGAVLSHLLPRPHLGFGLTDLSHELDLPISSLQHECYKLVRIGVLRDQRAKGSRHYRPNAACPLLPALTTLVLAAIGRERAVTASIEGIDGLHGAFLATEAGADERVFVLIGDFSVEEVDSAHARVALALNATVIPPAASPLPLALAYFRTGDWQSRMGAGNPYARTLLSRVEMVLNGFPAGDLRRGSGSSLAEK